MADFSLPASVSSANARYGLLPDLSNEAYHSGGGVSKSHLDVAARSLYRYWAHYIAPNRVPRESTPALVLGSAIHGAILEPDTYGRDFMVLPEDLDRRTKAGKEQYAELLKQAEETGATLLTAEQDAIARGCRDSVHADKRAAAMLSRGAAEQSFFALDEDTGELVKCRADWLDISTGLCLDVKSTEDASPAGFLRSILNYRYGVQEAWYRRVTRMAMDAEVIRDWVFLAVEKTPPYCIGLYRLPEDMVRACQAIALRNLRDIAAARMLDEWPGYTAAGIVTLQPQGWARRQLGMDTAEADFEGLSE